MSCEKCERMQVLLSVSNKDMLDDQDIRSDVSMKSEYNNNTGEKEYFIENVMYYYTPRGWVGTGDDKKIKIKFCPFCGEKLQ